MMGLGNYCWAGMLCNGGGELLWRVYTCPRGSRPDNEISWVFYSPVYKLHCIQFYSGDFYLWAFTKETFKHFFKLLFFVNRQGLAFFLFFFFKLSASNSTEEKKSVVWVILYTGRILIVQFDVIYLDKKM